MRTMWIKSSFSTIGDCVEVKGGDKIIRIRDDKRPDTIVIVSTDDWQAFIDGVKAGEFDLDKIL